MGFKEIGKKIQIAREERGWTQSDLAERLEITQAALSNYELGKRRLYLNQIQRFADILGKDLSFFISDELASGTTLSRSITAAGAEAAASLIRRIERCSPNEIEMIEKYVDYIEWRRKRDV